MPAEKQPCRHHIQGLEVLAHQGKDLLEIGQHGAGELVDQKRTAGVQHRMSFAKDGFPHVSRHGGVWNAGDDVIGLTQVQPRQCGVGVGRRAVHHMQPFVRDPAPKKPYEIGVGLQRHEDRIRPHTPEDLGGEGADPRPVLQEDSCPGPVHFAEDLIDQKAGAGDQTSKHLRMLDKVAAKEQDLRRTRGVLCGHGGGSAFHKLSCPSQQPGAGHSRRRRADEVFDAPGRELVALCSVPLQLTFFADGIRSDRGIAGDDGGVLG